MGHPAYPHRNRQPQRIPVQDGQQLHARLPQTQISQSKSTI